MIFASFHFDEPTFVYPVQSTVAIKLVRETMEHIRNRSILLGWIVQNDTYILTRETRSYWDTFIALLCIAQNVVKVPNVLTVRIASGAKA